ncbi:hypothetical protein K469DRAFT_756577 [Zopfia rhizophila CBS 207.26]|uniref:Uncharacterized protein n=1 Tax=Zopfia rhizophila CBS 207.26 TaxID=1314779 RepID=A0A6A6D606_9PEZI|nr:hypothetical protein K469DRAFT_756577 [Zopfia rhizophila CBS 207.26]
MSQPIFQAVLEARVNRIRYKIFKRCGIPDDYDQSAITDQILFIQNFHREPPPIPTCVSDLVQVILAVGQQMNFFAKAQYRVIYWAEGKGLVTGTFLIKPEFRRELWWAVVDMDRKYKEWEYKDRKYKERMLSVAEEHCDEIFFPVSEDLTECNAVI